MRVVFMGSAEFALESLRLLCESRHEVLCVYSRPPRRQGRGMRESAMPVHSFAETKGLMVRTPATLAESTESAYLRGLGADIAVVVAYGLKIPQETLSLFRFGGINLHPSLLPRWRGALPIERAVEAGDTETGISIMCISESLDSGDIVRQERFPMTDETTSAMLHERLSNAGAELLLSVLDAVESDGELHGREQDESLASYAVRWDKAEARLDFSLRAEILCRKIRAADSLGGCYFLLGDERIKVWSAWVGENSDLAVGTLMENWQIVCGDGRLLCLSVLQRAGGKRLSVAEFKTLDCQKNLL